MADNKDLDMVTFQPFGEEEDTFAVDQEPKKNDSGKKNGKKSSSEEEDSPSDKVSSNSADGKKKNIMILGVIGLLVLGFILADLMFGLI